MCIRSYIKIINILNAVRLAFILLVIMSFTPHRHAFAEVPSQKENKEILSIEGITKDSSLRIGSQIFASILPEAGARGIDDADDDVARDLAECKKFGNNFEMSNCNRIAYNKYDKILTTIYNYDLSVVDYETSIFLRESQRKWIEFRDADLKSRISYAHYGRHGSVMVGVLGFYEIYSIRERILELMLYTGSEEG